MADYVNWLYEYSILVARTKDQGLINTLIGLVENMSDCRRDKILAKVASLANKGI